MCVCKTQLLITMAGLVMMGDDAVTVSELEKDAHLFPSRSPWLYLPTSPSS